MKIEDITKLLITIENDDDLSQYKITNIMIKKRQYY